VFITSFLAGLCAVCLTLFIADVKGLVNGKRLSLASLAQFPKDFKRYLLALFILSAGSLPVAVMLLKTQSIGMTLASIPLFYMLYNISYAGFSISAGKWSDRIGPKKVIVVGYLILIASYVVLALDHSLGFLVVGFLMLGLFPALTDGIQRAYASTLTADESRGGAYGLVNAVTGFGALIAGIGGGLLWQVFGPNIAFITSAGLVVIGLLILTLKIRK
jgi:MFS family permease